MKAGTEELAKYHDVVDALGIDPPFVGGLLQAIWTFAAKNCPRGDIGRFTNRQIARGIKYSGDIDRLIDVLIATKWLDACDCDMRIIIHDWPDHAEDSVHRKLARAKEWFADGRPPNLSRLLKAERAPLEKHYDKGTCSTYARRTPKVRTLDAQSTPDVRPSLAMPSLAKPSQAIPIPDLACESSHDAECEHASEPAVVPMRRPESGRSGFQMGIVTEETLANTTRLRQWFDYDAKRSDAMVESSDVFWVNVQSAAAKALRVSGIRDRVALFKWLVRGRKWDHLRIVDDDFAAEMRRRAERTKSTFDEAAIMGFLEKTQLPEGVR